MPVADALPLPGFTPGVTTLGELSTRAPFQQASPKVGLVVVWIENGALRMQPLAQFQTAHADWAAWRVRSYTPGFASAPAGAITASDQAKWIGSGLANKGGDVGVIVDLPPVP